MLIDLTLCAGAVTRVWGYCRFADRYPQYALFTRFHVGLTHIMPKIADSIYRHIGKFHICEYVSLINKIFPYCKIYNSIQKTLDILRNKRYNIHMDISRGDIPPQG